MGSRKGGAVASGRTAGQARWGLRTAAVLVLALLIQAGWVIRPAWACGCGAMVPADQATLRVGEETSAVSWDGVTERIIMRLSVSGDAAEAAWIMPVPSRATLDLGDAQLFDRLERVVEPVEKTRNYFWPRDGDWPFTGGGGDGDSSRSGSGAAPGAPPVDVLASGTLGPFEFAQLAATDPNALAAWLGDNGFRMPDGMAESLRPYVEQRWEYVAVRLTPAAAGERDAARGPGHKQTLGGELDPLQLTFASDRLVYPMRLSQRATSGQTLNLFVFAPHRVEAVADIGGGGKTELLYAGRPDPEHVGWPGTPGSASYLTAMTRPLPKPSTITADFEFRAAPSDKRFQRVDYTDELLTVGGVPVWLVVVFGPLLALGVGLVVWARRKHERRMAAYPPPPPLRPL
ncbi:DUF2330 domain-containing protein [Streptodolium elevatio]|uniref:DUF2330 domain-containing protein n=1 Tax=Streptodolium elevatio TaxID=3157996 RepID=A0ABV3DRQ9_9ACTN